MAARILTYGSHSLYPYIPKVEKEPTTGAFYGYYDSKEELFAALVGEAYEYMMSRYKQAHKYFENLPARERPEQMGKLSAECMNDLLTFSCE